MCGRFTLLARLAALKDRFDIQELAPDYSPEFNSYNIAPTQVIPAVVSSNVSNKLISMKWTYVIGDYNVINARSDKIKENKTYYKSLVSNRCLIPADGFYEWKTIGTNKFPYYIRLKSKKTFCFGGFYQETSANFDYKYGGTLITTEPNSLVNEIHNRMPVILHRNSESEWLAPDTPEENLLEMLVPYSSDQMEMFQVSKRVNSVVNTTPDLIKPKISLSKFL
ncbi:MAG: putative SOS response-associated peptidase YedK [Candidatus Heimdallarchaeota archaeon LC_3]|nr:MAG: putative SOS response-associated peptidase YedK [Candidatus Heimdallarchaeota archaeon LC_3]